LERAEYSPFIHNPTGDDLIIEARTFSKVFGLAGIRLGRAAAAPENAGSCRPPSPGRPQRRWCSGALVAYDDLEYVQLSAKRNADDRQEFSNQANGESILTRISPYRRPAAWPSTSSSTSRKTISSSRGSDAPPEKMEM
jgi:histidinol-phosphate/aromatic aminotransferase/cobyric acid decarboxylase-like protein